MFLRHLVPWPSVTFGKNFAEIVPGEPLRRGELNTRGVTEYSDFGPIERYISETDRQTDRQTDGRTTTYSERSRSLKIATKI